MVEIEFEGYYDRKSLRKKAAIVERPSRKYLIRRLLMAAFLMAILIPIAMYIYQSREYFSRITYLAVLILAAIYYLTIHSYVAPYFTGTQPDKRSNAAIYCKGVISSTGITHFLSDETKNTPWNKIYRAKKTGDLIVLFVEYAPSMAFPRSFFGSDADWQQFQRWLDFYVKQRK